MAATARITPRARGKNDFLRTLTHMIRGAKRNPLSEVATASSAAAHGPVKGFQEFMDRGAVKSGGGDQFAIGLHRFAGIVRFSAFGFNR